MKKLLVLLMFLGIALSGYSQSAFRGFFKPVNLVIASDIRTVDDKGASNLWLFRPTIELTAMQFTYSKEIKAFETSSLQSAGFGLGYQHFTDVNGVAFNDYGFNALILFGATPTETTAPTTVSAALTVSALRFVNAGIGYNFGTSKMFILTGVTFNFN